MDEKLLNEIALFVQNLLRDRPMKYIEVRDEVKKQFNLSKRKIGLALQVLNRRGNFLSLSFAYEKLFNGVLYLPDHSSDARKLFREIRESIPYNIRYANKTLHQHLLSEARKIKLQNQDIPVDLLADVIVWKLKVTKSLAKYLIGELEIVG